MNPDDQNEKTEGPWWAWAIGLTGAFLCSPLALGILGGLLELTWKQVGIMFLVQVGVVSGLATCIPEDA